MHIFALASEGAARLHRTQPHAETLIASHTITGGTTEEFNYFYSFTFINMYCSLCPHVCLAQWETGF